MEQSTSAAAASAASAAAAAPLPPAASPSKYFDALNVKPTAEEVPAMFFLRPRPDGQPGAYTAEVLEEMRAALAAAKARGDEAEAALLQARWEAMLAAKAEALALGDDPRRASERAFAAGEAVKSSIAAPYVEPVVVQVDALGRTVSPGVAAVLQQFQANLHEAEHRRAREEIAALAEAKAAPHANASTAPEDVEAREAAEEIELALGRAIRHAGTVVELERESGELVSARKHALKEMQDAQGFGDERMLKESLDRELARARAARGLELELDARGRAAGAAVAETAPPLQMGLLCNELHAMELGSSKALAAASVRAARFTLEMLQEKHRHAAEVSEFAQEALEHAQRECAEAQGAFEACISAPPERARFGAHSSALVQAFLPGHPPLPASGSALRLSALQQRARAWLRASPSARAAVETGALVALSHELGDPEILPVQAVRSVMRPGQPHGSDSLLAASAVVARKRSLAAAVTTKATLLEQYPEAREAATLAGEGQWGRAAEVAHAGLERYRSALRLKELEAQVQLLGIEKLHGKAAAADAVAGKRLAASDPTLGLPRLHCQQDLVHFLLYTAHLHQQLGNGALVQARGAWMSFWGRQPYSSLDTRRAEPLAWDVVPSLATPAQSLDMDENLTQQATLQALALSEAAACESCAALSRAAAAEYGRAEALLLEAWAACRAAELPEESPLTEAVRAAASAHLLAMGHWESALELALGVCKTLEPLTSQHLIRSPALGSYHALVAHLEAQQDAGGGMDTLANTDAVSAAAAGALERALAACDALGLAYEDRLAFSLSQTAEGAALRRQDSERLLTDRSARMRMEAEAAAAAAEAELRAFDMDSIRRATFDSTLHKRIHIEACLTELDAMLSVPRWARLLHSGVRSLAVKRGRFPDLPGVTRLLEFVMANRFFDATLPEAEARGTSATYIFNEYFLRAAPLEPTISTAEREAAELAMPGLPQKNPFAAAADLVKQVLVERVLPVYLRQCRQGLRYIEERCLSIGLPTWTVPQIARLCEPERRDKIVWTQSVMRGWAVRHRVRLRKEAEKRALEAAEAARLAVEADKKAARRAARLAAQAAAAANDPRAAGLPQSPLVDSPRAPAAEGAAGEGAAVGAAGLQEGSAQAPAATAAEEAFAGLDLGVESSEEEEEVEEEDEEKRQRDRAQREREEEARLEAAAAAAAKAARAPPPRKAAAPSGGAGSAASGAAADLSDPAALEAAQAAAMAEAEAAALAEELGEQSGSNYMQELLGMDPYTVFQEVMAKGGTEEQAWDAFRAAERNARLYEEAFAKASSLGVNPATLVGADLYTVEQAIVAAKAAQLAAELAAATPEEAQARASRLMQKVVRIYIARKRVGHVANRLWVPFKDAATGYYYYTSLLTGASRWTLPNYLPSSCLTLKVLCSACGTALGERQCTTCHEAFCGRCCDAIHSARNLRQRHKCFRLPVPGSPSSAIKLDPKCLAIDPKAIMHAFLGTSDGLCLSCEKRVGTTYCASCEVAFCATCWPIMHARGARAAHRPISVFVETCNVDGSPIEHAM